LEIASTPLTLTRQNPSDDGQIVLDWDAALLSAIQMNASTPRKRPGKWPSSTRRFYDAVNAIDRSSGFLFVSRPAAPGASAAAATVAAANRTLSHLFPAQKATFDLAVHELNVVYYCCIEPGRNDGN